MWITQASCGPEADTAMLKKCVKAGSCLHPYLFLRLLARKCDRRHISFMRRVSGLSRCKGPALYASGRPWRDPDGCIEPHGNRHLHREVAAAVLGALHLMIVTDDCRSPELDWVATVSNPLRLGSARWSGAPCFSGRRSQTIADRSGTVDCREPASGLAFGGHPMTPGGFIGCHLCCRRAQKTFDNQLFLKEGCCAPQEIQWMV